MATTTSGISGDLLAALALIQAHDEAGHQLAGTVLAYRLVDPDADEATLREQIVRLTVESHALAQGLARVSRAWQDTAAEAAKAAERAELERLRVPVPPRATITRDPELAAPVGDVAFPELRGLIGRRGLWGRLRRFVADPLVALTAAAVATGVGLGVWTFVQAVPR